MYTAGAVSRCLSSLEERSLFFLQLTLFAELSSFLPLFFCASVPPCFLAFCFFLHPERSLPVVLALPLALSRLTGRSEQVEDWFPQ